MKNKFFYKDFIMQFVIPTKEQSLKFKLDSSFHCTSFRMTNELLIFTVKHKFKRDNLKICVICKISEL
ncbi:hypothetical protein BA768_10930 [Chryseobacterium sp. CBo1]|nr:hypothetical protein BA768_10930 [Chryseobacterium sp. CBo1]